ncbi:MAG TPA: hypothetical protein VEC76_13300 [Streptosporangiaceae bacterium]|nr:hypothetical protein [Streptosporangiaceae bacterium]
MRSDSAYTHPDSQRLADLKHQTEELERKLSDARMSLERELAQAAWSAQQAPGRAEDADSWALPEMDGPDDRDGMADLYVAPEPALRYGGAAPGGRARINGNGMHGNGMHGNGVDGNGGRAHRPADRTEGLLNRGRPAAPRRSLLRGYKLAIVIAVAVALVTISAGVLLSGGASWPPSVATVQAQAEQACQNPDVKSEPGQVDFACAQATRQILWVFALLTSGNNPGYADAKTGRVGLEPITPAQGGEVAWSLNLHHPYDPANPLDSLAVAARAINNIIGGATVTSANGSPVVQPGLESSPANCLRYTGSSALVSRKGFPSLCARPIAGSSGQAALVADVYQKWVVGAGPKAAQDAAVLFENADDPGNPQVQAILTHLPSARPAT